MRKLEHSLHLKVGPELLKAIKSEARKKRENMSVIIREILNKALLQEK